MKPIRKITSKSGGNLSIEELEELAHNPQAFKGYASQNLSYFTGGEPRQNFTTMTNESAAITLGNISQVPFLSEDEKRKGIANFLVTKSGENSFQLEIANAHSAAITVSLFAGAFRGTSDAPNSILDAVTNITTTVLTPNKKVAHLMALINDNPTLLTKILINSTDPIQVNTPFNVKRMFAFSDDTTRQLKPSSLKSAYQTNDTVAALPVNEMIDARTVVSYSIRAGQTVNLEFFFGPSLNTSVAFAEFMKAIGDSVAIVGETNIQAAAARAAFNGGANIGQHLLG
ncbi:hypothetical protein VB776_16310 [Arcicella sp. DC2W]|uniref:Uncharacterized protein n=1 Tax=Arcicella gelida TaxID=2984195 RepID=A0ABU5S7P5_9BACT|nr:hypothetical protein [Arcicella sp. DC2W]MEA5404497.1 hypothetical protein [Arcicella sp. DC2W]